MRGEPCSPAWRLSTLLLGASWVVALAVACGGGEDAAVATPLATGATGVAGSGARTDASAMAAAALPLQTPARVQGQAPGRSAATPPAPLLQPCSDESRRPAQAAAMPAHLRAPRVQGNGLDDEALNLPPGHHGAGAAGANPIADPFEAR